MSGETRKYELGRDKQAERDARIAHEKDMRVVVRAAATLLAAAGNPSFSSSPLIAECVRDAIALLDEAKHQMAAQTEKTQLRGVECSCNDCYAATFLL